MQTFEIISTLVLLLTIGVMIWQNVITRRASQSANVMELIKFLQDEDAHNARQMVYTILRDKPLAFILEDDSRKSAVTKVCTTYDIAGLLLRNDFAKKEIFLESWGPSIIDCYQILYEFILHRRGEIAHDFWCDFEWLYRQAVKHHQK